MPPGAAVIPVRIPADDTREIAATMVVALNRIGTALDETRAALIDGDLERARSLARHIIDQAITIGTVGL